MEDSGLLEDLIRVLEMNTTQPMTTAQPTVTEILPELNDDDFLAGILDLNDYTTDAVSSSNNKTDNLAKRMNQLSLSNDNNRKTSSLPAYSLSIAMGLARALRCYAVTGNFTHILTRLHHLFAIQSDDGDK